MISEYEADTILTNPESSKESLKQAFKLCLARKFFSNQYLYNTQLDSTFINQIFMELTCAEEWNTISAFLSCSRLNALLSQETIN